ncbi:MAG: rhomboid family intramembrane serine protease [Planctomycetes bacterium]|nr:rhomboid family intramembrane serine protease [Planctomycetota bacterium]
MAKEAWQDKDDDSAPRTTVQFGLPRLTPAVKWLMILNVGIFLASFLLYFFSRVAESPEIEASVFQHLRLVPNDWAEYFAGLPLWQLFTYGFLHADIGHIVGNMLMLFFFGTMLESLVGTRRFLLTYFASMVIGALVYLAPALAVGGVFSASVLGASGACFGIMIAMSVLRPMTRVIVFFFPLTLRTLTWILIAYNVFGLLTTIAERASGGTAYLVHLGGALYGFLAVRTGLIRLDPVEFMERRRAVKAVERSASDEARMDQLLEKIHREGMNSLTRGEKDFLKRMSARR